VFSTQPKAEEYLEAPWEAFEPYYQELEQRSLDETNLERWLKDWTRIEELVWEVWTRLAVAVSQDTRDEAAEKRYQSFLKRVYPQRSAAEQGLKTKLLESGLQPAGFEIPLRNLAAEAALFREENLPLLSDLKAKTTRYDKLVSAQTIFFDGVEYSLPQVQPVYYEQARPAREQIWRQVQARWADDRAAINGLWAELLGLRIEVARNAGCENFRAYSWKDLHRFDYTPADAENFLAAIEKAFVPAVSRIYEKRRLKLGVETLRPWDLDLIEGGYTFEFPPLSPFQAVAELDRTCAAIFYRVDPQLGAYYAEMQEKGLLDLANRAGKAPGAYCAALAVERVPFIFANSTATHDSVQTLLHEAGHAFHVFESAGLPYIHQQMVPIEFAEVASMAMELLSAPYLARQEGGFYAPEEAARARRDHLERVLIFWPYMAVVDGFQHWVYTHESDALDTDKCDAAWDALWQRFMPGVDWGGLEAYRKTGWHRKLHIHTSPFYYIEYGLAQLGAVQVWANAQADQQAAVQAYRQALSLGGTVSLPGLFEAAGARFSMDTHTLQQAVELLEAAIEKMGAV
jgi:oligoendopeptidase F